MKRFLMNLFILLCFIAVCLGVAYLLPLNIVMGLVIALQVIILTALPVNDRRDDNG